MEDSSKASRTAVNQKERASFHALLLINPNYFGNLVESKQKAVLTIVGNTGYEELACLGYHPQQQKLEAVVYLHQSVGYGTDICGVGTPEYVRFYLSYDHGATWEDQGMSSFQAHNIPQGKERLEFAVSLGVDPQRHFCFGDIIVRARAILSWNNPPPPNQPDWTPIWGNVREAAIQVEPLRIYFPLQVIAAAKVELPKDVKEVLDFDSPVTSRQKTLGVEALAALYKGKDIPVHRYAFKEIASFAAGNKKTPAEVFLSLFPGIHVDLKVIENLFPKTNGDTSYEELRCIGLDPNLPDTLIGVLQVKKSSGYSGGPCTSGSREYVTFWGDFDGNGSFETCLGTADVGVYDLANIPGEGVYYAVRLPVDLDEYRQDCRKGARVVRIRAILSWQIAILNPDGVPTWGNRLETLINIAPGSLVEGGMISILGGIPVSMIDSASGFTTPTAVFATNNLPPDSLGRPCPFGGRVSVQGAPVPGGSYKVEVFPSGGGTPVPVVADLLLTRWDGTTYLHKADPVSGRFGYVDFPQNVNSLIAQWDTAGDEKWVVRLTAYDSGGNLLGTDAHFIQLDNTWPSASISITTGTGDCGKFQIGTKLEGTFIAQDANFSRYTITVEPGVNSGGIGVPVPASGLVETGLSGSTWSLDTKDMKPCGYVLSLVAIDRTIVDSQSLGHWSSTSCGFCLV